MLWHRQAIFESKGDKLSSSAECRIRTQGLRHLFASRLNACWQTDWAIEDQAKNLNSTARPYDQQVFSPLDLAANWLSHLALAIYMFVVVNFDALAQASDIRIERRQVVFLCWMQDSNPRSKKYWLFHRRNTPSAKLPSLTALTGSSLICLLHSPLPPGYFSAGGWVELINATNPLFSTAFEATFDKLQTNQDNINF